MASQQKKGQNRLQVGKAAGSLHRTLKVTTLHAHSLLPTACYPRLVTHGCVTRAPEFPERTQTCAWIFNSGEQSLPLYLLGAIAGHPGQSQSNPCRFTTDISGGRKRKHELLSMERRNFSLVVLCTQVAQK